MNLASFDSALAPAGMLDLAPTASGPLDGVRLAVKDLFDVEGTVTGAGNPTLADGPPATADATAVAVLRAAGATLVAKTATDELAMGMFGVNTHYGTPPNPAAPDRVPGGSSSGSASMVAAGDADLGIGTDTGGSVRVPAAFCGLVGLRPTHGRIDIAGVRPMAEEFDTVGILTRTVELAAAAFAELAPARPIRSIDSLVILSDLVERSTPAVADRTERLAAAWAEHLGLELRHAPLVTEPVPADLLEVFWPLMSRQLWESNGTWLTEAAPVLGAGIAERITDAGNIDDEAVARGDDGRQLLRTRLAEFLTESVAVLPTTWAPPPLRDTTHDELMIWRDRNLAFSVPASLTGSPQLVLPAGRIVASDGERDDGSVPIGVSMLGLPGDDELLLSLAGQIPPAAEFLDGGIHD